MGLNLHVENQENPWSVFRENLRTNQPIKTLCISTTLYLEYLSISNQSLGPLDICVGSKLFSSLYLEPLYLEYLSISNQNLGPVWLFLSLSRTFSDLRTYLH